MTGRRKAPGQAVPRPLLLLYRFLLALALMLGVLILGGSLYAVFRGSGGAGSQAAAGNRTGPEETEEPGTDIFTGIGRLRIPLAAPGNGDTGGTGSERAALVLSIVFPYPVRDRAFTEELNSRAGDFRRIAREYFSARSADELRATDEKNMKADLLHAYNAVLRLGKIETLYFNDLLFFE
ncbi:MAG: flagellar basal body protein FliL [Treponema sp.]|jgi:flagellar basal body-associated protein FliL|nr:flagellar basal body protein FliL [Treponema sp.]